MITIMSHDNNNISIGHNNNKIEVEKIENYNNDTSSNNNNAYYHTNNNIIMINTN